MARGLGTALGVALVTLVLTAGAGSRPLDGPTLAVLVLVAAALGTLGSARAQRGRAPGGSSPSR
jgi:hypothetical protein